MSLGSFVGGWYTGAFAASALGLTRDGFRYRQDILAQEIRGDAYGDSIIDMIYRGGNAMITLVGIEYDSMATQAFSVGGAAGRMGVVGRLFEPNTAGSLVLTRGSAATTATPTTVTASKGNPVGQLEFNMENRLREFPLSFQLFPYASGGNTVWSVFA